MASENGIYVEIDIRADLDRIWELTQTPGLHQRWDLRFSRIEYLPRSDETKPQEFLYETRIGFGLAIRGTGESAGQRAARGGETTSSLRFTSGDPKSLIRTGSGYWRYIPSAQVPHSVRFLTWYDYQVRFGYPGRLVDALAFRPLIGWATAWSFDRLRLWAENGQSPETSLALAAIHAIARLTIAGVWLWHGIVPKLIYRDIDEQRMLLHAGLPLRMLPWLGAGEVLIGLLLLCTWNRRAVFPINGALMLAALGAVAVQSPSYLHAAFNPVTLNGCVLALSAAGWLAASSTPSAARCRRKAQEGRP